MVKRITIHDVAKAAGCSTAAVSMALNDSGRIGPEKRRIIGQIAEQMGYHPNVAGRNLRLRKTDTVGLMFNPAPSEIFRNIFYIEVVEGLEEIFYENGVNLLLGGSRREEIGRTGLPKFIRNGTTDAVILLGHFPDESLRVLLDASMPIFLLDSFPHDREVDCLTTDGFDGAGQAVRHLAELGHKRIAMLAYDQPAFNITNRIAGFQAAVKETGLSPKTCPVYRNFSRNRQLPPMLDEALSRADAPTAFFCVNDTLAAFVTTYLKTRGLSIPKDISVIGFDDDRWAREANPPLTTVHIDTRGLGRTGAEMVLARLRDRSLPPSKVMLPIKLVVRESTAAPSTAKPKRLKNVGGDVPGGPE